MENLRQEFQGLKEKALDEFFTFLRFASISSEGEQKEEVNNCASWVVSYLEHLGFNTELWETSGHPAIFASHMEAGPEKPTLLILCGVATYVTSNFLLLESPDKIKIPHNIIFTVCLTCKLGAKIYIESKNFIRSISSLQCFLTFLLVTSQHANALAFISRSIST